jgi:Fic family protein
LYNPRSTPNSIHQLIHRLNDHLKRKDWMLEATLSDNRLYLKTGSKDFWVRISAHPIRAKQVAGLEEALEKLTLLDKRKSFTATQASAILGRPTRSVQRVLRGLVSMGHLRVSGAGRATVYRAT